MGYTFKADATSQTAIIYENSDNLPPTDPFGYRSRVVFYSGFRYPARVQTQTGSVTFSAVASGSVPPIVVVERKTLFAHGLSGIPLVEGKWIGIGTSGADVPMVGSVPVQTAGTGVLRGICRWASLGADATNVYLYSMAPNIFYGGGLSSITLSYEIHVMDWLL